MVTNSEYALMAGVAYQSTRNANNRFPVPDGWTVMQHDTKPSGFEAISFQRGNEIVISFAGTDPTDLSEAVLTNLALGIGYASDQLKEATAYYLEILQDSQNDPVYPNPVISFTGHSLGGGLASLMGLYFDRQTVTFDQAPFLMSASTIWRDRIVDYLTEPGRYSESELSTLAPELLTYGTTPDNGLGTRQDNVTGMFVEGEFLTSTLPFTLIEGIGDQVPLQHGPNNLNAIELHDIALLNAFVLNDNFRDATYYLHNLSDMLFDDELYKNPTDQANENFLDHLIRNQVGLNPADWYDGNFMLDRFTADLQRIADLNVGQGNLQQALIAFAMQMYYDNPEAISNDNMELFTLENGGISFDRTDVAADLNNVLGHSRYFQNFINTLPTEERTYINTQLQNYVDWYIQAGNQALEADAGTERAFMLGGNDNDVITGSTDDDLLIGLGGDDQISGGGGTGGDIILGGGGDDTISSGYGVDILIGGTGMDTISGGSSGDFLYGGSGDQNQTDNTVDTLQGGTGNDTYYVGRFDVINDADQTGEIHYRGVNVADMNFEFIVEEGATQYYKNTATGDVIIYDTAQRRLTGFITIENFDNGNYGITFDSTPPEQEPSDRLCTGTINSDESSGHVVFGTPMYVFQGSIFPNGPRATNFEDAGEFNLDTETPPNLEINGLEGNDLLYGLAGYDTINGGSGDDLIFGDIYFISDNSEDEELLNPWTGGQTDYLYGGIGQDAMSGGFGDDRIEGGGGYLCL